MRRLKKEELKKNSSFKYLTDNYQFTIRDKAPQGL